MAARCGAMMKATVKDDPAAAALAMALEAQLGWREAGRVAFLRARPIDDLNALGERLVCEQSWKPLANALQADGFASTAQRLDNWGQFDLVLLLPERQREQTLSDLARGMNLLKPGGILLVSLANDCGASRYEKHLRELAGEVESLSKFHCRVFWSERTDRLDAALMSEWQALGALQPIGDDGRFVSRPGLFSWNEVDPGSQLLASQLPAAMSGRVADVGAGWGYLSDFLLRERPNLSSLDLYDSDARALEAAERNLGALSGADRVRYRWHDVTQGLDGGPYDWVVMNPPFHAGRSAEALIGHRFIAAAAGGLRSGGQLWMVANQHLPYERFLTEAMPESRVVVQQHGFKVLAGRKSAARSE